MKLGPIDSLPHGTVRLICKYKDGNSGSGTGFFVFFLNDGKTAIPCVVTNKHVLENSVECSFQLTIKKENGEPDIGNYRTIVYQDFADKWIPHPDEEVDLAVFEVGRLIDKTYKQGIVFFWVPLDLKIIMRKEELAELSILEDIIMIGYPNSIWDEKNNLPIIRKGITATHPGYNFNGKDEFVIDAACFPGSSGSPVFIANLGSVKDKYGNITVGESRIILLGILYAGPQHTVEGDVKIVNIPTTQKAVTFAGIPNNLGYVINAYKLFDFEEVLLKIFPKPNT